MRKWLSVLIGGVLVLGLTGPASALTLQVVDSLVTSNPFGVLFDGTNVWFTQGVGGSLLQQVNQNAVGMPLTGVTRNLAGAGCCGAMAWDGTQFVSSSGTTIGFFNAATGASTGSTAITAAVSGSSLIDGLDFDHNEIWWSPDVGNVYRLDTAGAFTGAVNPVLGGAGGFSGVERIDTISDSFLIVVNDAFVPRKLCKVAFDGSFDANNDCVTLPNTRYEDLAFDGRFLYAADVFGNRLDKIDLLSNGGSIFDGNGRVPAPATLLLLGLGLAVLGGLSRRKPA